MGVDGLWRLLEVGAVEVDISRLRGKRLAIDTSIWLYQFINSKNKAARNAHLVGMFRRLCKLLYWGIRPVFVFDGRAPHVKRRLLRRRSEQRAGQRQSRTQAKIKNLALAKVRQVALGGDAQRAPIASTPADATTHHGKEIANMDTWMDEEASEEDIDDIDLDLLHYGELMAGGVLSDTGDHQAVLRNLSPEFQLHVLLGIRNARKFEQRHQFAASAPRKLTGEGFSQMQLASAIENARMTKSIEAAKRSVVQSTPTAVSNEADRYFSLTKQQTGNHTSNPYADVDEEDASPSYGESLRERRKRFHAGIRIPLQQPASAHDDGVPSSSFNAESVGAEVSKSAGEESGTQPTDAESRGSTVYVGTCGFVDPNWDWVGGFYREDAANKVKADHAKLSYYAKTFNCVELNVTHYRFCDARDALKWIGRVRQSRADFRFSVKVHRTFTHVKRAQVDSEFVAAWRDQFWPFCEALGEFLGPILFQFPPSFVFSDENLANLEQVVTECVWACAGDRARVRVVMEFRHPSWFQQQVYAKCALLQVSICTVYVPDEGKFGGLSPGFHPDALDDRQTANWGTYYRLHGKTSRDRGDFGMDFVQELAQHVASNELKRIGGKAAIRPTHFVMFGNVSSCAPASAIVDGRCLIAHLGVLNVWELSDDMQACLFPELMAAMDEDIHGKEKDESEYAASGSGVGVHTIQDKVVHDDDDDGDNDGLGGGFDVNLVDMIDVHNDVDALSGHTHEHDDVTDTKRESKRGGDIMSDIQLAPDEQSVEEKGTLMEETVVEVNMDDVDAEDGFDFDIFGLDDNSTSCSTDDVESVHREREDHNIAHPLQTGAELKVETLTKHDMNVDVAPRQMDEQMDEPMDEQVGEQAADLTPKPMDKQVDEPMDKQVDEQAADQTPEETAERTTESTNRSTVEATNLSADAAPERATEKASMDQAPVATVSPTRNASGAPLALSFGQTHLSKRSPGLSHESRVRLLQALESRTSLLVPRSSTASGDTVTMEMLDDCRQLLDLFRVPYITADSEAEAQCAMLDQLGVVDGTVTDDSDAFLFGANTVYRRLFRHNQGIQMFSAETVETKCHVDRQDLIDLAMLLGSDYAVGVKGIGLVQAVEILADFKTAGHHLQSSKTPLELFGDYVNDKIKIPKEWETVRMRGWKKKLDVERTFPPRHVPAAYLNPVVDRSTESCQWGVPDKEALARYIVVNLGWSEKVVEQTLDGVLENYLQVLRETGVQVEVHATTSGQVASQTVGSGDADERGKMIAPADVELATMARSSRHNKQQTLDSHFAVGRAVALHKNVSGTRFKKAIARLGARRVRQQDQKLKEQQKQERHRRGTDSRRTSVESGMVDLVRGGFLLQDGVDDSNLGGGFSVGSKRAPDHDDDDPFTVATTSATKAAKHNDSTILK